MTKTRKQRDDWGQWVIYVQECKRFDREFQPECDTVCIHNVRKPRCDFAIIKEVENHAYRGG